MIAASIRDNVVPTAEISMADMPVASIRDTGDATAEIQVTGDLSASIRVVDADGDLEVTE